MKELILDYFNNQQIKRGLLKPLDNNYRISYTGVTLRYITYNVLKAKYKKQEVARCLENLFKTGQVTSLYCSEVETIVFQPSNTDNRNNNTISGGTFRSDLPDGPYNKKRNVYTYLKQFTKDE